MDLTLHLKHFVDTFQKSARNFGKLEISPTPLPIQTSLPLSPELETYFRTLKFEGKVQIGGHLHMRLFASSELIDALQGWRWVVDDSGNEVEDRDNWQASWVIIADRNGDAIFVDTSDDKVFASIQGEAFFISENLGTFIETLTEAIRVEMNKYDYKVRDSKHKMIPEFENDIRDLATQKLGPGGRDSFMDFFFG